MSPSVFYLPSNHLEKGVLSSSDVKSGLPHGELNWDGKEASPLFTAILSHISSMVLVTRDQ